MAWLSGWDYRKSHVINQANDGGTGYQISVTVHYGNGSDSGNDVYLNSKCKTNFGDIRFTDDDCSTELDHWMQEKVDSDYAVFWVKVADDLSSSNATIYVYYGNVSASSTSDFDATFIFGELWDNASLDTNKWTSVDGNPTYSIDTANHYLEVTDMNTGQWATGKGFHSKTISLPSSWMIEDAYGDANGFMSYESTTVNNEMNRGLMCLHHDSWSSSDWGIAGVMLADAWAASKSWQLNCIVGGNPDYQSGLQSGASKTVRSKMYKVSGNIKIDTDGTNRVDEANSETPDIFHLGIGRHTNYPFGTVRFGAFIIRKYIDPEPSHGSWGSEEEEEEEEPPILAEAYFETGGTSEFDGTETSNGIVTATSDVAHHGSYSCKCDVNGNDDAYAEGYFDIDSQEPVYCRGYFRFNRLPETNSDYTIISFENTSGPTTVGYIQLIDDGGTKKWKMRRTTGGGAAYSTSTSNIPEVDTWVCVEFVHGENLAKLWVDGDELLNHTDATDQTTDRVHIGACSSDIDADDTLEIHIDCIIVTDEYIGPESESGDLEVNNLTVNNVATIEGGAIELGDSSQSGTRPYIDFHYGIGGSEDFNVRLQNYDNKQLDVKAASSGGQLNLVNMELAFEGDAKISRDSQNSLKISGDLAIDEILRTHGRVYSYDQNKFVDDDAPNLTNLQMIARTYGWYDGDWQPQYTQRDDNVLPFLPGSSYVTFRDNSFGKESNMFIVTSSQVSNDPLLSIDSGFIAKKDIYAGGVFMCSQGALLLGHGLIDDDDPPKISLTHSDRPFTSGSEFPTEDLYDGQFFYLTQESGGKSPGYYYYEADYDPNPEWLSAEGSTFPADPAKWQLFVRTDYNPHILYQYNDATCYPPSQWVSLGGMENYEVNYDTLHIVRLDGETLANVKLSELECEELNAVGSSITLGSDLVPPSNETGDLGYYNRKFEHLYVKYIGQSAYPVSTISVNDLYLLNSAAFSRFLEFISGNYDDQLMFYDSTVAWWYRDRPNDRVWVVRSNTYGIKAYVTENAGNLYIDGSYQTFSPKLAETTEGLIAQLKSEVTKPYAPRDNEGKILCEICGKPRDLCEVVEHQTMIEETYGHDIGLMAMGAARLATELAKQVKGLQNEISKLTSG